MMIAAAATLMPNDRLPGERGGRLLSAMKQHCFLLPANTHTRTHTDTQTNAGKVLVRSYTSDSKTRTPPIQSTANPPLTPALLIRAPPPPSSSSPA